MYGGDIVHVETEHKPLEPIFVKELNVAPRRLQRMLLQTYSLRVTYKKGRNMYLADTLSHAFLPDVNACEFTQELEAVDHRAFLPVSKERWQQIKYASADDPVLQQLRATIRQGWPKQRSDVPGCLYAYFDIGDVLTVQDELVFKGQLVVVPASLRKGRMAVLYSSHIGIEGCVRKTRPSCDSTSQSTPRQPSQRTAATAGGGDPTLGQSRRRPLRSRQQHSISHFRLLQQFHSSCSSQDHDVRQCHQRNESRIRAVWLSLDVLVTDNGFQFASAEFSVFAIQSLPTTILNRMERQKTL